MKKSLLYLAMCLWSGTFAASAVNYLPRDSWSITPCSEIDEGNGSGAATCMIDADVNTYWHSNWSNDVATDAYHWFIIDLGKEEQIDGFDYRRRQGNSNGQFISGKIYVSNDPFTAFADHDVSKAFFDSADNAAAAEFNFSYDEDADGIKRCTFDTPVNGRYLLVILSDAGANSVGRHACGGDFKVFTSGTVTCQYDTRSWEVTPCSQSTYEGSNGPASLMFDDDPNTYWHQAWENDGHNPHWFIVDMLNSYDIDGFNYMRRQGNGNGSFKTGKVYVNDEGFTAFADHDAARAYYDNTENVAAGSFNFDFTENPDNVRVCEFEQTAHGRYMLVIINEATTVDACCGSFKPFFIKGKNLENEFLAGIATNKKTAETLSIIGAANPGSTMPSTALPDGTTADNLDEKISETNNNLQTYINSFNNKELTLKCALRRQNSPYLGAIVSGSGVTFNTLPSITPDAIWSIQVVNGGIRLFNRTTGFFIGTDQSPKLAANAQTFVPAIQTQNGQDYVMFYKGNSNVFISVDTGSTSLGSWSEAGDQGAPWIVSAAEYDYEEPQLSTETEKHYYRIVNARWMYQMASPSMATNGENQQGNGIGENNNRSTANIPGIYWTIEDAGDGAVNFVNLSGYKLADNLTMTAEGSPLYLFKQTDAQFNGKNCYGISKNADATVGVYYDVDRASGNGGFRYHPTLDGAGNRDNGCLWYFIAASDNEISNATTAYTEGVRNHSAIPVADEHLAALMGEDFMKEISEQYFDDNAFATISSANAAKATAAGRSNAIKTAVEAEIGNKLTGNFMIQNANSTYSNCFLSNTLFTPEEGEQYYRTAPTAETNDLNSLWAFEPTEGGYILRSSGNGMALTKTDSQSQPIPLNETGLAYTVVYNPIVPGFNITLAPESEDADVSYYALHQSNNDLVCKWIAQNIAGSHWHINALEMARVEFAKTEGGHTMTLGDGITLNDHASAEGLTMTITKITEENEITPASVEPADGVHTISAADFANGAVSLAGLTTGKYEVTAPAGMFLVNGKHASLKNSFTVDTNGDPLAIDEIEAANHGATVIYDLQGRRVNRAAHGIYIVNGRKVIL